VRKKNRIRRPGDSSGPLFEPLTPGPPILPRNNFLIGSFFSAVKLPPQLRLGLNRRRFFDVGMFIAECGAN
jgi:hypothetical protein